MERDLNEEANLSFTLFKQSQLLQCKLLITTEHCACHGESFSFLTRKLTQTNKHRLVEIALGFSLS